MLANATDVGIETDNPASLSIMLESIAELSEKGARTRKKGYLVSAGEKCELIVPDRRSSLYRKEKCQMSFGSSVVRFLAMICDKELFQGKQYELQDKSVATEADSTQKAKKNYFTTVNDTNGATETDL
ncbi:unnamed protein product [Larinioides sclopetarius]|uniref:Uncharacterized protein n=1 Tax=Larinioides sclopetarius TaxID=280406 RepID=A0AAV2AG49_9ARAC